MGNKQGKKQTKYGKIGQPEQLEMSFQDDRMNKFVSERERQISPSYQSEPRNPLSSRFQKLNNRTSSAGTNLLSLKLRLDKKKSRRSDPIYKKTQEIQKSNALELSNVNCCLVLPQTMSYNISAVQEREEMMRCPSKQKESTQFLQRIQDNLQKECNSFINIDFTQQKREQQTKELNQIIFQKKSEKHAQIQSYLLAEQYQDNQENFDIFLNEKNTFSYPNRQKTSKIGNISTYSSQPSEIYSSYIYKEDGRSVQSSIYTPQKLRNNYELPSRKNNQTSPISTKSSQLKLSQIVRNTSKEHSLPKNKFQTEVNKTSNQNKYSSSIVKMAGQPFASVMSPDFKEKVLQKTNENKNNLNHLYAKETFYPIDNPQKQFSGQQASNYQQQLSSQQTPNQQPKPLFQQFGETPTPNEQHEESLMNHDTQKKDIVKNFGTLFDYSEPFLSKIDNNSKSAISNSKVIPTFLSRVNPDLSKSDIKTNAFNPLQKPDVKEPQPSLLGNIKESIRDRNKLNDSFYKNYFSRSLSSQGKNLGETQSITNNSNVAAKIKQEYNPEKHRKKKIIQLNGKSSINDGVGGGYNQIQQNENMQSEHNMKQDHFQQQIKLSMQMPYQYSSSQSILNKYIKPQINQSPDTIKCLLEKRQQDRQGIQSEILLRNEINLPSSPYSNISQGKQICLQNKQQFASDRYQVPSLPHQKLHNQIKQP